MKRMFLSRIRILLLLFQCFSFVCSTALADLPESFPVQLEAYSVGIDPSADCDEAFEQGNDCYHVCEYEEAYNYYLLALQQIDDSSLYCLGDVCNNLVLTLLQLDRNQEAMLLCRYMLEMNLAPSVKDRYGYMLNQLVCAHACGISAVQTLREALEGRYFSFETLSELVESDRGAYTKLLNGMIYNVVYMDMEGDPVSGAASYNYFPMERFYDLSGAATMEELAELIGGNPDTADEEAVAEVHMAMPKAEYLSFLRDILECAIDYNEDAFQQSDPDIEDLIEYLNIVMEQV